MRKHKGVSRKCVANTCKHNRDRAKKEFGIKTSFEVKRIKEKYSKRDKKGRSIKPAFFGHVARQKGYYDPKHKKYQHHLTTMDFLQESMRVHKKPKSVLKYTPFSELVITDDWSTSIREDQIKQVLWSVRDAKASIDDIWNTDESLLDKRAKRILSNDVKQESAEYIANMKMPKATMRKLLMEIEAPKNSDVTRFIFYNLFAGANSDFYKMIKESATPIAMIRQDDDGDIDIYGLKYSEVRV